MGDTVIVGVLSLVGTLAGTLCGILSASKLTNYRIKQLEAKVDKHNTVVERTYNLESHARVLDEQVKVINHRLADVEDETEKRRA